MEQRWRLALHLTRVIEPRAVDPSDDVEETEDNVTPDEAGPSGGAGGGGGSAAAAVRTNAVWFQAFRAYPIQSWQVPSAQARVHLRCAMP